MLNPSEIIQQLNKYNIHIALLQETMLIEKDKLYIKNYKIYRADADIRRRRVLILVSNQLDAQTYPTYKDNDCRYIQIRIKQRENNYI